MGCLVLPLRCHYWSLPSLPMLLLFLFLRVGSENRWRGNPNRFRRKERWLKDYRRARWAKPKFSIRENPFTSVGSKTEQKKKKMNFFRGFWLWRNRERKEEEDYEKEKQKKKNEGKFFLKYQSDLYLSVSTRVIVVQLAYRPEEEYIEVGLRCCSIAHCNAPA